MASQDFYTYSGSVASLAPAAQATINLQIEADSDFEWMKTSFFSIDSLVGATASNAIVVPLITIQIQDSGSGRNLFSQPVIIHNVSGNGALPFVLPVSRRFRANSNIGITLTNVSSGTTYLISEVSLIGRKIWKA